MASQESRRPAQRPARQSGARVLPRGISTTLKGIEEAMCAFAATLDSVQKSVQDIRAAMVTMDTDVKELKTQVGTRLPVQFVTPDKGSRKPKRKRNREGVEICRK